MLLNSDGWSSPCSVGANYEVIVKKEVYLMYIRYTLVLNVKEK